ncbi:MAG: DUF134 domain-containing protein [Bacillota bacterium]
MKLRKEVAVLVRPTKLRRIENIPTAPYFIPAEKEVSGMPKNVLKLEELEAIRLKDLEGFEQKECAEKMEISRPTFQRILLTAREKIADSLLNGKIIHIEGGHFTCHTCPVKCQNCGNEWTERVEKAEFIKNGKYTCSSCGSTKITCQKKCQGKLRRSYCWCYDSQEK